MVRDSVHVQLSGTAGKVRTSGALVQRDAINLSRATRNVVAPTRQQSDGTGTGKWSNADPPNTSNELAAEGGRKPL